MARTRISIHGLTLAQLRALDRACKKQLVVLQEDADLIEWQTLLHAHIKVSEALQKAET